MQSCMPNKYASCIHIGVFLQYLFQVSPNCIYLSALTCIHLCKKIEMVIIVEKARSVAYTKGEWPCPLVCSSKVPQCLSTLIMAVVPTCNENLVYSKTASIRFLGLASYGKT